MPSSTSRPHGVNVAPAPSPLHRACDPALDEIELIHICREHPHKGQICRPDCRAYCGFQFGPTEIEVHNDEPTMDDCVVCAQLYAADWGDA